MRWNIFGNRRDSNKYAEGFYFKIWPFDNLPMVESPKLFAFAIVGVKRWTKWSLKQPPHVTITMWSATDPPLNWHLSSLIESIDCYRSLVTVAGRISIDLKLIRNAKPANKVESTNTKTAKTTRQNNTITDPLSKSKGNQQNKKGQGKKSRTEYRNRRTHCKQ